jgi:hypothetical protein
MSEYRRDESTVKKTGKLNTIALIGKVTLLELLTSAWAAPPLSLDNFRDFTDSEDSGENVDFWIDGERLLAAHNIAGNNSSNNNESPHRISVAHQPPAQHDPLVSYPVVDRWQNWNDLIEDYVRTDSSRPVNLPGPMRTKILIAFENWKNTSLDADPQLLAGNQSTFLDALRIGQREIYAVMNNDTFPRFLKKTTVDTRLNLSKEIALWWRQKHLPTFGEFMTFPSPVNLAESRLHNIVNCVLITGALALDFWLNFPWIYFYIVYGYIARVLAGPRLDLMAFLVLFVFRPLFVKYIPLLKDEFVPGPPRRLAQAIGLSFAATATILRFTLEGGLGWYCFGVWAGLWIASWFAGFLDICFACLMFAGMMKGGCIPDNICAECRVQYMYHKEARGSTSKKQSRNE